MKNLILPILFLCFISCEKEVEDDCKGCYQETWSTKVTPSNPDGDLVFLGDFDKSIICGETLYIYENIEDRIDYHVNNVGDTLYYTQIFYICE